MGRLNGLDLFSGIAGNSIGLRSYIKTLAYCEYERHAQAILFSRMSDGDIETAPIWDDVTTLTKDTIDLPIDIITAGFPCQDTSVGGKQLGVREGKRSGLFYHVARLARELEPEFIFLENVHGILSCGGIDVVEEITSLGFDLRWCVLSASDVGAFHGRKRWFGLAHRRCESHISSDTQHDGSPQPSQRRCAEKEISNDSERSQGSRQPQRSSTSGMLSIQLVQWEELLRKCDEAWKTQPNVPRNIDGVPYQVDRIKRLGNAVVPKQAKIAFEFLMGL